MKGNEKKMSIEDLKNEQVTDNKKCYESPNIVKLGKMQKVTLGKAGSALDGMTVGEEP